MVRPFRHRWAVGILAVALAAPLALVASTPAQASETDSIPITSMPGCGDIADPTSGGWTGPRLFASRHWYDYTSQFRRPVFLQIKELCAPNNTTYGVRYQINGPNGGTWASNPPSSIQIERASGWQKCYNSTGAVVNVGTGGFNTLTPVESDVWNTYGTVTMANHASCVRLIEATFKINWRVDDAGTAGTNVSTTVVWSAARSISGEPYTTVFPPELAGICADMGEGEWALCESIREKNSAAWADTCGEASNADSYGVAYPGTVTLLTGEFDVTGWFTWHMACLFIPLAGFDRDATVATAWEASPNAEIGTQIVGLADAFVYAPGCGVLAATPADSPLPGFALDTCTWTWAEPVKIVLGIGVLLLGFWAFIAYCVKAVSGVIRKDVPSPVESS